MATRYLDAAHAEIGALTGGLFRPGGLALTDRALALYPLPPRARVLDVGCGSGATVRHLIAGHHLRAVGLDRSVDPIDRARHGDAYRPFVQATAERLPLADASADAVLAECVLSTLADPARALAEFARVLAPAGGLVVTDLYARDPSGAGGLAPRGAILDRVRRHGFEVIAWQDHSDTLRDLAVRLVWAYGPGCGCATAGPAPARRAAGYFLLVARKGWRATHGRP